MLKLVDSFPKFLTHPSNFSSVPSASSLTVVYMMCYKGTQRKTNSITYNSLPWINLIHPHVIHILQGQELISSLNHTGFLESCCGTMFYFFLCAIKRILWHTQYACSVHIIAFHLLKQSCKTVTDSNCSINSADN